MADEEIVLSDEEETKACFELAEKITTRMSAHQRIIAGIVEDEYEA